jgi:hypothetical protein
MNVMLSMALMVARRRAGDELSGIPFRLRLQTHRGDGLPFGLYQNTACTIPATADGHAVAAWRDELSGSGLVAIQSVSTKRPILRIPSGNPVLEYDGVDDFLSVVLPRPFPFSLATGAKSNTTAFGGMAGYGSGALAIGNAFAGFAPSSAFWLWGPDTGSTYGNPGNLDTNWHVHQALVEGGATSEWSMILDGITGGAPGVTGTPVSDVGTTLCIGQDGNGAHWGGRMSSYLQSGGIWDSGAVSQIQLYLDSLLP